MKRLVLLLWFTVGSHRVWSQSTIAYTDGPAFEIPYSPILVGALLDLNHDTAPELNFYQRGSIYLLYNAGSFCTTPFFVTSLGTNSLLTQGSDAWVLSGGQWIGPIAPSNSVWSVGGEMTLLTWWYDVPSGNSGAYGPLHDLNDGYLGVRFWEEDGPHYGWGHVREPAVLTLEAAVLDWAYETVPGVPIMAGAKPAPVPLNPPQVVRPGYFRLSAPAQIRKGSQVQVTPDP